MTAKPRFGEFPVCPYCNAEQDGGARNGTRYAFDHSSVDYATHFQLGCFKCAREFEVTVHAIPEYESYALEPPMPPPDDLPVCPICLRPGEHDTPTNGWCPCCDAVIDYGDPAHARVQPEPPDA